MSEKKNKDEKIYSVNENILNDLSIEELEKRIDMQLLSGIDVNNYDGDHYNHAP